MRVRPQFLIRLIVCDFIIATAAELEAAKTDSDRRSESTRPGRGGLRFAPPDHRGRAAARRRQRRRRRRARGREGARVGDIIICHAAAGGGAAAIRAVAGWPGPGRCRPPVWGESCRACAGVGLDATDSLL